MKISINIHRQDPNYTYWFTTSTVTSTSASHTVILLAKVITICIFRYNKKAFKAKVQ